MFDDFFGEGRADACDIGEQGSAGGIDFDADLVDAAFDDFVELFLEEGLVDVVLVLADADGLGIDFDEFCEGILESPSDGDRAANGEIEVREFFAGDIGGAVDAGPGLVDLDEDDIAQPLGFEEFFEEGFGFASTCTVADGDGIGRILGEEGKEVAGSACFVACGEIKGGVVEEFASLIDGHAFAACALAGVDADDAFFTEGRGEQEVA